MKDGVNVVLLANQMLENHPFLIYLKESRAIVSHVLYNKILIQKRFQLMEFFIVF
jgi:hypothetical protein